MKFELCVMSNCVERFSKSEVAGRLVPDDWHDAHFPVRSFYDDKAFFFFIYIKMEKTIYRRKCAQKNPRMRFICLLFGVTCNTRDT